jgi:UDP-N-acetylglucosamine 2-epimerase
VKLAAVVGARPNFVKVAPILAALRQHGGITTTLIHSD